MSASEYHVVSLELTKGELEALWKWADAAKYHLLADELERRLHAHFPTPRKDRH